MTPKLRYHDPTLFVNKKEQTKPKGKEVKVE
jgi:hypothetical protein